MAMTEDDLSKGLFSLFGELKLTLGDISNGLKQQRRWQAEARKAEQPSYNRIHASGIVPASGFIVLRFELQGPNQGYTWHIRNLVIGSDTPATAMPGRADLFVSASDLTQVQALSGLGIIGWRDSFTTLPFVDHYSEGEQFLHANEEPFVVISGATAGQNVYAMATVQNVQESAASQVTAI